MDAWDLLETPPLEGAMNMAVDEALLQQVREGRSRPVLRFYTWQPPCLSLGFFQRARRDVDWEECRRRGVEVVRRATGGRSVLHDRELTYSVVVPEDHPLVPAAVSGSYRLIARALQEGFSRLGMRVELSGQEGVRRAEYRSAACFEAPSSYEVLAGGKKIVGSAQVRRDGVLLQHGSIVNAQDPEALFSLLRSRSPERRAREIDLYCEKATSIAEVAGRELPLEDLREAFRDGFREVLGIRLLPRPLDPETRELAETLVRERYRDPEWTFLREAPPPDPEGESGLDRG